MSSDTENSVGDIDDSDIENTEQEEEEELEEQEEQEQVEDGYEDVPNIEDEGADPEEEEEVDVEVDDEEEDDELKKTETSLGVNQVINTGIPAVVEADDPFKFDIGDDTDDEEDDEEEDEDEEVDLEKIDYELKQDFLKMNHPEKMQHNYDEVYHLAKVLRNKHGDIIDDMHKTTPILNKYEKAKILGTRANQINNGSKPFITLESNVIDAYVIAHMELQQKKMPFIIRRPIPNGGSEYWHISDLENI